MNHDAKGDYFLGVARAHGAWQMHKGAWLTAGGVLKDGAGYECAHDPVIARRFAKAYISIQVDALKKALKREPTAQEVYACYRKGLGFMRSHGFDMSCLTKSELDSCQRVANLCK